MSYAPQTWVDNSTATPLSAARLTVIETGIQNAATTADSAAAAVAALGGGGTLSADNITDGTSKVAMTTGERTNLATLVAASSTVDSAPFWIPGSMFTRDAAGGTLSVVKTTGSLYALPQFLGSATTALTAVLAGVPIPAGWTQFRVRISLLPNSSQTTNLNIYVGAAWQEFASNAATIPTTAPTASSAYTMVTAAWPNGTYGFAEAIAGPFTHTSAAPFGSLFLCRDKTAGTPDTSGTSAYLYGVGIEKVA